jgi:hypothetical protein
MSVLSKQLLSQIENSWPQLGIYLRQRETVVSNVARYAAVGTESEISTPGPPASVNVKVAGELAHVTIEDPQAAQRGGQYHVELATNPQFSQPHVEHLGSSRGRFVTLPTNDDSGTPHTWYARAFVQYAGSQPGAVTNYGGAAPAGFQMQGATNMTPLPSTGSGTASSNGQQGGWGLGKTQIRPTPAPKRAVSS